MTTHHTEAYLEILDRISRMTAELEDLGAQAQVTISVSVTLHEYKLKPSLTEEWVASYDEWITNQHWPDDATHATLDKEGGTIWWHGEPALASDTEYGWQGDIAERYHDPEHRLGGVEWRDSLRQRPAGDR